MHLIEELLELIERDLKALGIDVDKHWRDVRSDRVKYRKTGTDQERLLAGGVSVATEDKLGWLIASSEVAVKELQRVGKQYPSTKADVTKIVSDSYKGIRAFKAQVKKQGLTLRMVERVVTVYFNNRKLLDKAATPTKVDGADVAYVGFNAAVAAAALIFWPLGAAIPVAVATTIAALSTVRQNPKFKRDLGGGVEAKSRLRKLKKEVRSLNVALNKDKAQLERHEASKSAPAGPWAGLKDGTDLGHVGPASSAYGKKQKKQKA